MKNYGAELILDIHKCDVETFTRSSIAQYFERLCKLIDMEAHDFYFWDYDNMDMTKEEWDALPPEVSGISAIQFIMTSNITIHALDKLRRVYVNIFSCKDFDPQMAEVFSRKWFRGTVISSQVIDRI